MLIEFSKKRLLDLYSIQDMEMAYRNIMNEIIEHVIEGICYEAHRAVKLGYFPKDVFILKNHTFEVFDEKLGDKELPQPDDKLGDKDLPKCQVDIFGNKENSAITYCPECGHPKAGKKMFQHYKICIKIKNNNISTNGKVECFENHLDGNNGDGKQGNNTKRPAKSAPNYETMTPEQTKDFLSKKCGVISKHTERPCNNSLKCRTHSIYDRNEIRDKIFRSWSNHLDDNIDIDVDTAD